MKAKKSKDAPQSPTDLLTSGITSDQQDNPIGKFFDLLLRIDKRNNPELYGHNKSRTSSD